MVQTKSREHAINSPGLSPVYFFYLLLSHFSPVVTREARVVTASGPLDFSTDTTKEPKITIGEFCEEILLLKLSNVNPNRPIAIIVERARWSEWSEWSACTTSCGGGARKRFDSNSLISLNNFYVTLCVKLQLASV